MISESQKQAIKLLNWFPDYLGKLDKSNGGIIYLPTKAKKKCEEARELAALLESEPKCKTCNGTGFIARPVWDVQPPNDGSDLPCPDCESANAT